MCTWPSRRSQARQPGGSARRPFFRHSSCSHRQQLHSSRDAEATASGSSRDSRLSLRLSRAPLSLVSRVCASVRQHADPRATTAARAHAGTGRGSRATRRSRWRKLWVLRRVSVLGNRGLAACDVAWDMRAQYALNDVLTPQAADHIRSGPPTVQVRHQRESRRRVRPALRPAGVRDDRRRRALAALRAATESTAPQGSPRAAACGVPSPSARCGGRRLRARSRQRQARSPRGRQ